MCVIMRLMFLAYLDESGDKGWIHSPSEFYVLSCLLVHESCWLQVLDDIITLRRQLKNRWGILVRAELKAAHFRTGHGPFEDLGIGLRDRMNIFKDVMEFQANRLNITSFAVAIDKARIRDRSIDALQWAWTFALQRIDHFCSDKGEHAIVFPDEGEIRAIRKLIRKMRRVHAIGGHYGGKLDIPTRFIVEDPRETRSQDSYFIQITDWNAYAAHHSKYVKPVKKVRSDLWDILTPRLLQDVNKVTGGPPGIVKWP